MNTSLDLPFSAEILHAARPDHLDRLRRLGGLPGYETFDALDAQLKDLVQTRQPGRKLGDAEIQTAVAAHVAGDVSSYGAWAHYPWSRRLVRVLSREDFIELRTNRNQQKITAGEQASLAGKCVGIIGLSVGQSVALTLALERSCGEIRLADFDVIDLSNLNRLRCGIHSIGLPKAVVAAREIAELDPYLEVVCFNDGYSQANSDAFLDGLDVVVDECDSLDIKLLLREAARSRGIPVLMNTSDRGMTDIERFDVEPARPLFHGRTQAVRPEDLAGLSTEEKVPVVLDIIGLSSASVRLKASMLEIDQSIKTWPQLASDVTLGGAIICDVTRRLLLGESVNSGRYYMDLADIGASPPVAADTVRAPESPTLDEPLTGDTSIITAIIADAVSAPSAGNVQPWQWSARPNALTLRHRRGCQSSVLYHDDKAAMVGLGATLESALISARARGMDTHLELAPGGDVSASITLVKSRMPGEEPLHAQLSRRRSVRSRPTSIVPIPRRTLDGIAAQASVVPTAQVSVITDRDAIAALADLVGDAERLRILDPESHSDMMREIAWCETEHRRAGEGIPLSSLALSATEKAVLQIVRDPAVVGALGEWNLGGGLGRLNRDLVSSSSAMGLLWTASDSRADYLSGGRALQRLWLEATRADVGLCPVTSICYLLSAWRSGRPLTPQLTGALPDIEKRFRALFGLPSTRGDIALFRLVPAAGDLALPRPTCRRRA